MKKLLLFTALLIAAVSAFGQNAQRMDARMVQSEIEAANASELLNDRENPVLRNVQPLSENVVFFEGFEGTTPPALPPGWETTGGWMTTGPITVGEQTFPPHTGNRGLFVNWNNRPNFPWVFSSGIDMQAGVEYTISFWFHAPGYSPFLEDDDFKVQIGQSKAVTPGPAGEMPGATTIFTFVGESVTGWEEATFNFTPAVSGTYYLGFHIMTPNDFGNRVFIDDVSVISSAELPPFDFILSVTGTHTFPNAILGYGEQAAQTVTITNRGTQPTGELTVALSGANANAFEFAEGGGGNGEFMERAWNVTGYRPDVIFPTVPNPGPLSYVEVFERRQSDGAFVSTNHAGIGGPLIRFVIYEDGAGNFFFPNQRPTGFDFGGDTGPIFQYALVRSSETGDVYFITGEFDIDIVIDGNSFRFADIPLVGGVTGIDVGIILLNAPPVGTGFPGSMVIDMEFTAQDGVSVSEMLSKMSSGVRPRRSVQEMSQIAEMALLSSAETLAATTTGLSCTRTQTRSAITIPSIAAGGTAVFNVRPVTGLAIGYYTATVTVSAGEISRYFDVSFRVTGAGIEVISKSPQHNAENVALDAEIRLTFSQAVAIGDWMGFSFTPSIPGITMIPDGAVLTFPHSGLAPATTYTITISAAAIVGLEEAITWSFTTGSGVGLPTNESADIRIYPNPVGNEMYIQTEQNITRIVVLDMQGRVVLQQQGGSRTVNMQSVAAGIYTVQIHTEAGVVPIRIVKK